MDLRWRALIRVGVEEAIWALLPVSVLLGFPFLFGHKTSLMGQDTSSLAAGIVSYYPQVAAVEALKLAGVAWLCALSTGLVLRRPSQLCKLTVRLWIWPGSILLASGALGIAAIIRYPAMFEARLPKLGQTWVIAMAQATGPMFWQWVSVTVLMVAAVLATLAIKESRQRWWQIGRIGIVSAAMVWLLCLPAHRSSGPSQGARTLPTEASTEPGRPNILLLAIDSLRYDQLQILRDQGGIGELLAAPEAVVFSDHLVGVPRTFPSWIEMLEGRYSSRNGIRHMFPGFAERQQERPGLVTSLHKTGYQTLLASDFAGDIFPRFKAGYTRIAAPKLDLRTMIRMSVAESMPAILPLAMLPGLKSWFPALKQSPSYADPAHLVEDALDLLADGSDSPYFLTIFFSTAHFPYAAPYPYYLTDTDRDYRGPFRFQKNPALLNEEVNEADVRQVRGLYAGAVRSINDQLKIMFDELKSRGLWNNTIVLLTADHGEDLFESGRGQGHGEHLWGENVLKVPLLIKMPKGQIPSVSNISFVSRAVDLMPTLLGLLGLPKPEDQRPLDGIDWTPWIRGLRRDDPQIAAISETEIWFSRSGKGEFQNYRLDYPGISGLLNFDQGYSGEIVLNPLYESAIITAKHRALSTSAYKLIYMPTKRGIEWQLFDRMADPESKRDIKDAMPEVFAKMKTQLLSHLALSEVPRRLLDDYVVADIETAAPRHKSVSQAGDWGEIRQ